jgi:hypothetical protein
MSMTVAPTANYNSFISTAYADAFHDARGNDAWGNADNPEAACIKATDYILTNYVLTEPAVDDLGVVNPLVERATALLAFYSLTEDLFAVRDSREVIEEESHLGTLSERKKYNAGHTDRFPAVSAILSPITGNQTNGGIVVGRLVR